VHNCFCGRRFWENLYLLSKAKGIKRSLGRAPKKGRAMEIIIAILTALGGALSPVLRDFLIKALVAWEKQAASTSTPVDDLIVRLIKALVGAP